MKEVIVGSLLRYEEEFRRVGWFIPPYVTMGWLGQAASSIKKKGNVFSQTDLQNILSLLFSPEHLAGMVLNRYPKVVVVRDYQEIIAESIEAHFLRLDHISAAGLVPVVEGIGRKLAQKNGVEDKNVRKTFYKLAEHCKQNVTTNQIGAVSEIVSMLNSYVFFLTEFLFTHTDNYALDDGTNRNGIAHGLFSDKEFGSPLNFYKIITAVDFLTFISSIYNGGSFFAPDETAESRQLAIYYKQLSRIAELKPRPNN